MADCWGERKVVSRVGLRAVKMALQLAHGDWVDLMAEN
jgi:hypothetical protein